MGRRYVQRGFWQVKHLRAKSVKLARRAEVGSLEGAAAGHLGCAQIVP